MNFYVLVEGRRTEMKVYPQWFSFLLPDFKRVFNVEEAVEKNYFIISGEGYPSIYHHIDNALFDLSNYKLYNTFLICLDSEEYTINERRLEISNYIEEFLKEEKLSLSYISIYIIIQNRCIETWMLGNKKVFSRNPTNELFINFSNYYNVLKNDPEEMGYLPEYRNHADFHFHYLKEMLKEKNIKYSKTNPYEVCKKNYLLELIKRSEDGDINSFRYFLDCIIEISKKHSTPATTV